MTFDLVHSDPRATMFDTKLTPFALFLVLALAGCLPGGGGDGVSDTGPGDPGSDSSSDTGTADTGTPDAENTPDSTANPDGGVPDAGSEDTGPQCSEQQRACDGQCATCPSDEGISTTRCDAGACIIASCEQGYRMCDSGCCEYTPPDSDLAIDFIDEAYPEGLDIAVDSDGYPHVLLQPEAPESLAQPLLYARWDGASWSVIAPFDSVTDKYDSPFDAELVLDDRDVFHIAASFRTQRPVESAYATTIGGDLEIETFGETGDAEAFRGPVSLTLHGDGVCIGVDGRNRYPTFCGKLGAFEADDVFDRTGSLFDLATDSSGQLHMCIADGYGDDMSLLQRGPNIWNRSGLLDAGDTPQRVSEDCRLEPLKDRQLALAYYATDHVLPGTGLKVVTLDVLGDEDGYEVAEHETFDVAQPEANFHLATDGEGKVAMVYNKTGTLDEFDHITPGEAWLAVGENGSWSTQYLGFESRSLAVAIGPFGDTHVVGVDAASGQIRYLIR